MAEILGALTLVTDLGMAHPPEEAMRICLLATRLAREANLDEQTLSDIYYTAMLRFLGCNGSAHEEAAIFAGDDVGMRDPGAATDFHNPRDFLSFLFVRSNAGKPLPQRMQVIGGLIAHGKRLGETIENSYCEVGAATARRLGLPETVRQALYQIFERWDGKGPHGLSGEEIPLATRFTTLATVAVVFDRLGGSEAARTVVASRSGKMLDPGLAAAFARHGESLLALMATEDGWVSLLAEEPKPNHSLGELRLEEAAHAFADLQDLKSPYFHGHSSGVALLVESAAQIMDMNEDEIAPLRRAALLHDLGRMGVPNGIWEKAGPLTAGEWEQVRLHPYHTERILQRSSALAPLGAIAGMHHERQDGSGYHRQLSAASITREASLLAAGDSFHAMTEERPHRAALSNDQAAQELKKEAEEGRLEPEAVAAVLEAAGHQGVKVRRSWPAGLTDREVEVLRLVAKGLSNKEIAKDLVISSHTVRHHTLHIYDKIGAKTRAGAALFAMEKDLLRH